MKTIKLKSILKLNEAIDQVLISADEDGDIEEVIDQDDWDARTFIVAKDYAFVGDLQYGVDHHMILANMIPAVNRVIDRQESADKIYKFFDENSITLIGAQAFCDDILNANSNIRKLYMTTPSKAKKSSAIADLVSGRYWSKSKIISFAYKQDAVIKVLSGVKKMMSAMKIKNFNEYSIDFPDRDKVYHSTDVLPPLVPVKDV